MSWSGARCGLEWSTPLPLIATIKRRNMSGGEMERILLNSNIELVLKLTLMSDMWLVVYSGFLNVFCCSYCNRRTDRQILWHHIRGVCGFFLSVKFATSLLASLAGDKSFLNLNVTHFATSLNLNRACSFPIGRILKLIFLIRRQKLSWIDWKLEHFIEKLFLAQLEKKSYVSCASLPLVQDLFLHYTYRPMSLKQWHSSH